MASTHTDFLALRPSIEVPADGSAMAKKTRRHAINHKMPPEHHQRLEMGRAQEAEEAGLPPLPSPTPSSRENCDAEQLSGNPRILLSSQSKLAGQTVAPFLARHIPDQYAPLGSNSTPAAAATLLQNPNKQTSNTKYCYRHRPDSLCRRTADEPSMEKLQQNLQTLSQADQQGISHVWSLFSAAPAKHRNLMLQGILSQCCFPQLSYLSATVRDMIRIDFVSALPSEISYKILCYLDTTSLCKAAQVSQKWRNMADDDVVWHKMCEQHIDRKCTKCGWGLPLLERKRLRDWKRQQQLRGAGRGLNEWSPNLTPLPDTTNTETRSSVKRPATEALTLGIVSPELAKRQCTNGLGAHETTYFDKPLTRPWKDVYKDRFKVGTNWKHGRYSTRVLRGHQNGVMCLQFDDNMLATGSYDNTIKIWDIETGQCLRTLTGHTLGIRTLQFDDTKLISGSLDRTVKVWNWRTGECISTFQGHTEGVIAVHFEGNILASGSIDKSVKIWNFCDKSTFSLRGHKDWVNAVKVDSASRTVFSASDDCTVRLWDLDTKRTIRIFEGHVGQVQQVTLMPAEYEPDDLNDEDEDEDDGTSSTSSSSDSDEFILTSTADSYAAWCPDRPRPPRYMLTGALDGTIRLWDVTTGKCLKTLFGHVEGVWALAADTLRVVSGAEDRMVKVWDARTGKYEKTFTGHEGAVTCLGLCDSRVVTGSEDCTVRVLSFKDDEMDNCSQTN